MEESDDIDQNEPLKRRSGRKSTRQHLAKKTWLGLGLIGVVVLLVVCLLPPIRARIPGLGFVPPEFQNVHNAWLKKNNATVPNGNSSLKWEYEGTQNKVWLVDSSDYKVLDGNVTFEMGSFCSDFTVIQPESKTEYIVLVNATELTLLSEHDRLPEGCEEIFKYDTNNNDTWNKQCSQRCDGLQVSWYHPSNIYCGMFVNNNLGDFRRTCEKVKFSTWMNFTRSWSLRFMLAAVYFVIGACVAQLPWMEKKLFPCDDQTSGNKVKETGRSDGLKFLAPPLCGFPSCSDRHRAWLQFWTQCPTMLLDNAVDFFAVLTYAAHGQPFYFVFTTFALLFAGYYDLLQVRSFIAASRWHKQGFKDRTWMQVAAHEGGIEAPLAGLIAFFALMRVEPNYIDFPTFLLLIVSVISSVVVAMPNASAAYALIALDEMQEIQHEQHHEPPGVPEGAAGSTPDAEGALGDGDVAGHLSHNTEAGNESCSSIEIYEEQERAWRNVPFSVRRGDSMRLLGVAFVSVISCWGGFGSSLFITYLIAGMMVLCREHGGHDHEESGSNAQQGQQWVMCRKAKAYVCKQTAWVLSSIFLVCYQVYVFRFNWPEISRTLNGRWQFVQAFEPMVVHPPSVWLQQQIPALIASVQLVFLALSFLAAILGFVVWNPIKERADLKEYLAAGTRHYLRRGSRGLQQTDCQCAWCTQEGGCGGCCGFSGGEATTACGFTMDDYGCSQVCPL